MVLSIGRGEVSGWRVAEDNGWGGSGKRDRVHKILSNKSVHILVNIFLLTNTVKVKNSY